MKFNLEETVTGADLRSDGVILTFSRDRLSEVFSVLAEREITVDAFVVDRQKVTAAVFLPEETSTEELLPLGVTAECGYFRLILRGHRLSEGRGLARLWETVLADASVPVRLSCADGCGITQYLPGSSRPAVLSLLSRTFGITAV